MTTELANLIAIIAVHVFAVTALALRLRWQAVRQKEYRLQMVELARALPDNSIAESQDGPGGLHIKVTTGQATERDR